MHCFFNFTFTILPHSYGNFAGASITKYLASLTICIDPIMHLVLLSATLFRYLFAVINSITASPRLVPCGKRSSTKVGLPPGARTPLCIRACGGGLSCMDLPAHRSAFTHAQGHTELSYTEHL